jgi:hypothetical protein
MFPKTVERRLSFIDKNLCEQSDGNFVIGENTEGGKAKLHLCLRNAAICFKKIDKHTWPYLTHKKCADSVVFKYADGKWSLHIFEFKTTVRHDGWEDMQTQFDGALLNALVIAGFLKIDIDIHNATVHSCFRNDRLSKPKEPVELRLASADKKFRDLINSWSRSDYKPNCCENIICNHIKIKLDEQGTGEYIL